jgi:hypothetical protein
VFVQQAPLSCRAVDWSAFLPRGPVWPLVVMPSVVLQPSAAGCCWVLGNSCVLGVTRHSAAAFAVVWLVVPARMEGCDVCVLAPTDACADRQG